jgi:hypothetical protein
MSHSGSKRYQGFKKIWLVSILPFSLLHALISNTVNVTTPAAVVISSHVEGSKSIADCSPISLDDSSMSDPSDAESPPPVTPSDSQTHEPITTKPISRPNNVSILDFDLNTLTFPLLMGDSKYDDDDDDLSGLELVYPDNVC